MNDAMKKKLLQKNRKFLTNSTAVCQNEKLNTRASYRMYIVGAHISSQKIRKKISKKKEKDKKLMGNVNDPRRSIQQVKLEFKKDKPERTKKR